MTRQIEAGIVGFFTALKGVYFYLRSWTVVCFFESCFFSYFMRFPFQRSLSFMQASCGEVFPICGFGIQQERSLETQLECQLYLDNGTGQTASLILHHPLLRAEGSYIKG